jgi:hypothetical protein
MKIVRAVIPTCRPHSWLQKLSRHAGKFLRNAGTACPSSGVFSLAFGLRETICSAPA